MAIYITQIEKYKFVCGLFWQSLSRPRELEKEARELGKKIEVDLMVLRNDQSTAQAGFAHSSEGAKRGMFSLGAIVSKTMAIEGAFYDGQKQRVHNWLAAFKLPDGKWAYFAVRDANFLPNGDFAGTKEEVLERLHGDYGLGGWNVVIGDPELADYGFHNFESRTVLDLIPHRKNGAIRPHRWWALQPLRRRKSKWPIAAAAGVAVAVAGAAGWQTYQRKQQELQQERDIAAARQQMQQQGGQALQTSPWAGKPGPLETAKACIDRLAHLTPGGWKLDEYACTGDKVSYGWSRNQSTAAFLREQVPGAEIDPNGEKATYSETLTLKAKEAETLLAQKDIVEPIVSTLQLMGVTTQISSPGQGGAVVEMASSGWRAYTYKIHAHGLAPVVVASVLDQPGVRIDKMIYRGGDWAIEGMMYVK
jgi:hypothetical protein